MVNIAEVATMSALIAEEELSETLKISRLLSFLLLPGI
jgi:hypothetical protein